MRVQIRNWMWPSQVRGSGQFGNYWLSYTSFHQQFQALQKLQTQPRKSFVDYYRRWVSGKYFLLFYHQHIFGYFVKRTEHKAKENVGTLSNITEIYYGNKFSMNVEYTGIFVFIIINIVSTAHCQYVETTKYSVDNTESLLAVLDLLCNITHSQQFIFIFNGFR